MKGKKITIVFVLLLVILAIVFYGKYFLFQMDWELISTVSSPDKGFTIKYYKSRSEAGHAPYGDNLVIESWRSFPKSKTEETFFAGYCGKDFSFKWEGNKKIIIRCHTNVAQQAPIITQAILIQGIVVEVKKNNAL